MSDFKLHSIHQPANRSPLADIVFIHGLGGDPFTTWGEGDNYWPKWLGQAFPAANIWSLGHPSGIFASMLTGKGMNIDERGRAIVDYFEAKDIGTNKPALFIVHSLGGLLIKAALRKSSIMAGGSSALVKSTAGIVFMATPHSGSSFANAAKLLNKLFKLNISKTTLELEKDTKFLDDLSEWYKGCVQNNDIKTAAYYETTKYLDKAQIVTKESADPKVNDCFPVAVDTDHIDICKFNDKESPTYERIKKFIKDLLPNEILFDDEDIDDFYIKKRYGDRLSLRDKLEKGNRIDEYSDAKLSKEHIEKKFKRYRLLNSSKSEQIKFIKSVYSRFNLAAKPLIDNGGSIEHVNDKILDKVIDPIVNSESKFFDEEATVSDVMDAIYFLTGNCHIKWSSD